MMTKFRKGLFVASITLGLVACGGGGGGESAPTPASGSGGTPPTTPAPTPDPVPTPDLGMSVSASSISIDELQSDTLTLTFTGVQDAADLQYTYAAMSEHAEASIETVSVNTSGAELKIIVPEIYSEGKVELKLSLTDGDNRTVESDVLISLNNVSAAPLLARFENIHGSLESFMTLSPEQALLERVISIVALSNNDLPTSSTADFDSLLNEQTALELRDRIGFYKVMIRDYEQGFIGEQGFGPYTQETMDLVNRYMASVNETIDSVVAASNGIVPGIPLGQAVYSDSYGMISQFVGNPKVGSYQADNNQWVFSESYAFLENISLPGSETCDVE